jgi:hypothetical protein
MSLKTFNVKAGSRLATRPDFRGTAKRHAPSTVRPTSLTLTRDISYYHPLLLPFVPGACLNSKQGLQLDELTVGR